ncbi:hypothetical protein HDU67_006599 [Dinochytrium kinnereticum]|nr:hypothetical protein HDU67_006599 [Dinochytrium kinnereticum]
MVLSSAYDFDYVHCIDWADNVENSKPLENGEALVDCVAKDVKMDEDQVPSSPSSTFGDYCLVDEAPAIDLSANDQEGSSIVLTVSTSAEKEGGRPSIQTPSITAKIDPKVFKDYSVLFQSFPSQPSGIWDTIGKLYHQYHKHGWFLFLWVLLPSLALAFAYLFSRQGPDLPTRVDLSTLPPSTISYSELPKPLDPPLALKSDCQASYQNNGIEPTTLSHNDRQPFSGVLSVVEHFTMAKLKLDLFGYTKGAIANVSRYRSNEPTTVDPSSLMKFQQIFTSSGVEMARVIELFVFQFSQAVEEFWPYLRNWLAQVKPKIRHLKGRLRSSVHRYVAKIKELF